MNKNKITNETDIRFISDSDLKESIATHILADLPDWFGLPESTKDYIEQSRERPFWAAYRNNEAVGFIVLKETSNYTAEIYVMGVLMDFHRQQIGEQLFYKFVQYAKDHTYEYIQVKTVDRKSVV